MHLFLCVHCVGLCVRSISYLYFSMYIFFYLCFTIQDYPAENKVNDLVWDAQSLTNILLRYNPLITEYDDDTGKVVWNCEQVPVLFDPFEQFGSLLRACAMLGWTYRCKAATNKISMFINKNWMKHLQAVKNLTSDQVFFLDIIFVLFIFQLDCTFCSC